MRIAGHDLRRELRRPDPRMRCLVDMATLHAEATQYHLHTITEVVASSSTLLLTVTSDRPLARGGTGVLPGSFVSDLADSAVAETRSVPFRPW